MIYGMESDLNSKRLKLSVGEFLEGFSEEEEEEIHEVPCLINLCANVIYEQLKLSDPEYEKSVAELPEDLLKEVSKACYEETEYPGEDIKEGEPIYYIDSISKNNRCVVEYAQGEDPDEGTIEVCKLGRDPGKRRKKIFEGVDSTRSYSCFSPNGRLWGFVLDKKVRIIETKSCKVVKKIPAKTDNCLLEFAFLNDDQFVYALGDTIFLGAVESGEVKKIPAKGKAFSNIVPLEQGFACVKKLSKKKKSLCFFDVHKV